MNPYRGVKSDAGREGGELKDELWRGRSRGRELGSPLTHMVWGRAQEQGYKEKEPTPIREQDAYLELVTGY